MSEGMSDSSSSFTVSAYTETHSLIRTLINKPKSRPVNYIFSQANYWNLSIEVVNLILTYFKYKTEKIFDTIMTTVHSVFFSCGDARHRELTRLLAK